MSMPIASQGEQFDVFDDDRWSRDRRASVSHDDVAEMLRGPQIMAGLNNTRQAAGYLPPEDQKNWDAFLDRDMTENPQNYLNGKDLEHHRQQQQASDWDSFLDRDMTENPHHYTGGRLAVDTSQMPPDAHAYHEMPDPHAFENNGAYPGTGNRQHPWEPSQAFERAQEEQDPLIDQDDESGYNWGPQPGHDPGMEPGPHPDFHGDAPHPFGTPTYNPRDPSFSTARRHQADGGPDAGGELFNPMLFAPGDRQRWESDVLGGGEAPHWPTASVRQAAPVVPQIADPVWLGHGYAPGNRIGLQWRDGTIPGTVTHLDGPKIGVRWDDGQHSTEEPQDISRLH